jgi:hypothetical protein
MLATKLTEACTIAPTSPKRSGWAVASIEEGNRLHASSTTTTFERVEPKLPVLVTDERRVIATHSFEQLPTDECGRANTVAEQQSIRVIRRHLHDPLPRPEETHDSVAEVERRLTPQCVSQEPQRIGGELVVGVENQRVRRPNSSQPVVAGFRNTCIGLSPDLHLRRQSVELNEC